MHASEFSTFEVLDDRHGPVPCAALVPKRANAPLPACLFLYGGGGSHESLAELQPLFDSLWSSGMLAPLLVATPNAGAFSFYLDDPERGQSWESFVADRFCRELHGRFGCGEGASPLGIVGASMGGYGALKIALSRPQQFAAVAAISPMLEPGVTANEVPLRNRYHYPPEVPQALLGAKRDAALFERDHPATRARLHAAALRDSGLAIYVDAAGLDALHAHDGAEYLHRVLWDLDVAHEYHLRRDADHIGPDIVDRLRDAFGWVAAKLCPPVASPLTAAEADWREWLDGERGSPPPPPLPPVSRLFPEVLRALLASQRMAAAGKDPTFARRYGVLR